MGTSAIGSKLLRTKSDMVNVRFVNLKLGIKLKLNIGSDKFIKGSNLYPHRVMDTLDVNELTGGIMKSCINMEHPFGMIIKASGGLSVLLPV